MRRFGHPSVPKDWDAQVDQAALHACAPRHVRDAGRIAVTDPHGAEKVGEVIYVYVLVICEDLRSEVLLWAILLRNGGHSRRF